MADAEQIHVTVSGESQLTISWASPSGTVDDLIIEELAGTAKDGDLGVEAGTRRVMKPASVRYRLQNSRGLPGVYASPLLLHADISVRPKRSYRYRVGTSESTSTRWRVVRAPPQPGSPGAIRIAMVGDIGQTEHSARTCASLAHAHAAKNIDLAVLIGDLAYADGNQTRWDSFGRFFDAEGCTALPWLVLPGNHEIDLDDLSKEAFLPYRKRWRTPQVKPEELSETFEIEWPRYTIRGRYDFGGSFYSIRSGHAHLIMLNPYTQSSAESAQIRWLRDELSRVNRTTTPYLLVFTHAPWRHSSRTHQVDVEDSTASLQRSAEELLVAAGADMIFSGHVHAYERSHPIDGIRHFVLGHGGNREQLYDAWDLSPHSAFHAGDHYGWGELTLESGAFSWLARSSDDSAIVDSLVSSHGVPPGWASDDALQAAGGGLATWVAFLIVLCYLPTLAIGCYCFRRMRANAASAGGAAAAAAAAARAEERLGFRDAVAEAAVVGAAAAAEAASPERAL
eukprot:TRINITY_DN47139_c0_g1_i1.p1 TRINITY_DN47139_c0_g1~~TRINITY_DN47139_c0_g1_i1.p1  ORF type:complete len:510 (+),score=54.88 TRINITY_DN47139_c0_g1_i1:55-1584(+)